MADGIIGGIVGAVIGGAISALVTWKTTKTDLAQKNQMLGSNLRGCNEKIGELNSQLTVAQEQVARLSDYEKRYKQVKQRLEKSSVVREYAQPVLLMGPRGVGKTSLRRQLHVPWDHSNVDPTVSPDACTVPVYDFLQEKKEPHFADPEVSTDVFVHLKLRVHDFPGEISAQDGIIEVAKRETHNLQEETGKRLGIVVICMLDAEQAVTGLKEDMRTYYNGDLFAHLRSLVACREVGIERLLLVFNKYDLLKQKRKGLSDIALMRECVTSYEPIISLLKGTVNQERECEVFTILCRRNMIHNNRGAPIVLGEAARRFVEVMAGAEAAQASFPERGTNYAAPYFSI